ncbi:hypothetical protein [Nakamurella leprariae]|uniref:Uncharacterized protein n=1 Tax=Nakamurella leprariae TaxID=2803911 RepID=A0A939BVX1_9ACTN|nr:hypothetical protein [Nakamurella leprariae]MBM9466958.1 hypothetical protein [Nakamurella leprariae]
MAQELADDPIDRSIDTEGSERDERLLSRWWDILSIDHQAAAAAWLADLIVPVVPAQALKQTDADLARRVLEGLDDPGEGADELDGYRMSALLKDFLQWRTSWPRVRR